MTDATRLARLEAVAEAARSMTHGTGGILAVKHAVEALDALPHATQPAGDVVECWTKPMAGLHWVQPGTQFPPGWRCLGSLRLDPPPTREREA